MVELRKRPPPKETAADAPAAKRSASKPRAKADTAKTTNKGPSTTAAVKSKVTKAAGKAKAVVMGDSAASTAPAPAGNEAAKVETENEQKTSEAKSVHGSAGDDDANTTSDPAPTSESKGTATTSTPLTTSSVGKSLETGASTLTSQIQTHTSESLTLADLLSRSTAGIIIFTYPRANTPGCTTQACLFRDNYTASFKDKGWDVYGLSNDSPKANTGFVNKQGLGFELLCDVGNDVIRGLGFGKAGGAKGAVRGVVGLVKGEGEGQGPKVAGWMTGGPQKTLDAALEWVK